MALYIIISLPYTTVTYCIYLRGAVSQLGSCGSLVSIARPPLSLPKVPKGNPNLRSPFIQSASDFFNCTEQKPDTCRIAGTLYPNPKPYTVIL